MGDDSRYRYRLNDSERGSQPQQGAGAAPRVSAGQGPAGQVSAGRSAPSYGSEPRIPGIPPARMAQAPRQLSTSQAAPAQAAPPRRPAYGTVQPAPAPAARGYEPAPRQAYGAPAARPAPAAPPVSRATPASPARPALSQTGLSAAPAGYATARTARDLPPAPAAGGSDPLAELARIMGDQDPFADFGALEPEPAAPAPTAYREAPAYQNAPAYQSAPAYQAAPAYREPSAREPAAYREAPAYERAAPQPQPRAVPTRSEAAPAAGAAGAVRTGYGSLARQPAAPPPAADEDDDYDDYAPVTRSAQDRGGAAASQQQRGRVDDGYDDEPAAPRSAAGTAPRAYDEAAYSYSAGRRDDNDEYDEYDDSYDPQFAEDGYMPPHGEELYEGEPRRRRGRTALLAVAGVLTLAVVGTASVYAYQMATGGGSVTGAGSAPPVIRADNTPAKTTSPAPAAGEPSQKLIYDRVGAPPPGAEKVVPREEQPVDVTTAARFAPSDPVPSTGSVAPNPTEPKRVKTMTVRADNALASSTVTAYAPTQNPVPAGLPVPTSVNTIPLSGAQQTASISPPVSENGAYVVQVASQRTESDAMGSWKALQARYPNLLGGYRASVKKADLGERGVYYRAQVGPFASADQANELCRSLKAQGGDCLVNKN